jgi:hypothetical protein
MQTAKTILEQLGGNKFIVMTGANKLTGHEHGLSFRIGRNKTSTNYVVIALEADDTYTMFFSRVTVSRKTFEVKNKINAEYKGIYCDQLREIFESETGMATSLGRIA